MPKIEENKTVTLLSHDLFLGVDGGGTKTHAVILSAKREIVSEGFSGPSNPLRVGIETAAKNIRSAVVAACDKISKSPSDIVCASLGLAGVRRSDLREQIRLRVRQMLGVKMVTVVTDAEIALYGTTLGKPGLVIISGTGSICFGKDERGNTATAGGWGPIAGDEGGGVSIAKQGLQAIAKSLDGRGRDTRLKDVAAEYFRASTPEDLIIAIYSPQMDNRKLAGFAKFVIETAKEDDEIAVEILSIAGFELGLAAYAVIKKLDMKDNEVPIGTVGSIFKAGQLLT
ncbi:MAG: hypothetical protein KDB79_03090, partial [Acidobacteria bacterium]|nr:hypothetical protein [Acidobacteriota bacterium]